MSVQSLHSGRLATAARIFLGATFVVFGINGFVQFMPSPPMPPAAGAFLGALAATGYMFPLIKLTEITAGALLLSRRTAPLGLVVITPVLVNIVAFHVFLEQSFGLVVPALLSVAALYLARSYWPLYRPLWQSSASASVVKQPTPEVA